MKFSSFFLLFLLVLCPLTIFNALNGNTKASRIQTAKNKNLTSKEVAGKTASKIINTVKSGGRFITKHAATVISAGVLVLFAVMKNRKKSTFSPRHVGRQTRSHLPSQEKMVMPQQQTTIAEQQAGPQMTMLFAQQSSEAIMQELRSCRGLPNQQIAGRLLATKEQIPQGQRAAFFEALRNLAIGSCSVCENQIPISTYGFWDGRQNPLCKSCAEVAGARVQKNSLGEEEIKIRHRIIQHIERLAEEDEFLRPYSSEYSPSGRGTRPEPCAIFCQLRDGHYRFPYRQQVSPFDRCFYCANEFGPHSQRVGVTWHNYSMSMHADCAHDYYEFREGPGIFGHADNIRCPLCEGTEALGAKHNSIMADYRVNRQQ